MRPGISGFHAMVLAASLSASVTGCATSGNGLDCAFRDQDGAVLFSRRVEKR